MHDLPALWQLQQASSKSVSGEDLELYGKKAASAWSLGEEKTLNDAVVETVKHAGLSPEQVRRVIEFANTSAYLNEFKKEGSQHRVIEFAGGPADPSEVLKDLNDGGGGTVFDHGMADYNREPSYSKTASALAENEFWGMLGSSGVGLPESNPFGEVIDLREKIASLYENQTSQLSGLEVAYMDLSDRLYEQVKQASMHGYGLGQVIRAWGETVPDPEYVKVAFEMLVPRLMEDEVFRSLDSIGASIEKVGSARMVNPEHPLIGEFVEYCEVLTKMAHVRAAHEEAEQALNTVNGFLTNASEEKIAGLWDKLKGLLQKAPPPPPPPPPRPGIIPQITGFFKDVSVPVQEGAQGLGEFLLGEGSKGSQTLGRLAGGAVRMAPYAAGGLLAYRGLQHLNALGQTPAGRAIKSYIPGTPENAIENAQMQAAYAGQPLYPGYVGGGGYGY